MKILNWPLIRHTFGMLLMLETCFLALSTGVAAFYAHTAGEEDWMALGITTLISGLLGGSLMLSNRHYTQRFSHREGFFIVSVTWVLFTLIGMLPYLLHGTCHTVADAFLETMSGFTTTGCTVLGDIDQQPHGILLWRSITQWIGGLGIVVFTLALLPAIATGNIQMFSAEVTGMTVDKLRPKIQATSRRLWFIYIGLTALCALLYWVGGMTPYDGICHAMTTLSSGGFSTHQASIGYFQSSFIEYVCCIFLFITSINFSLFYIVQRGHWQQFWRNEEFRWFTWIVAGFTLFFCLLFFTQQSHSPLADPQLSATPSGLLDTFRTSLFHVLTIISTCGFQGEWYDYCLWGYAFWLPTLVIMACGGCAGSTAGGLKVLRVVILLKNIKQELFHHLHPNSYTLVRLNDSRVDTELVYRTLAFVFIFLLLTLGCTFCLQYQGLDTDTAIGTTISAFGNCGPGLGSTGPAFTWAALPSFSKWVLSFAMLIGRLEFFTVILLFTPSFWKK